MPFTMGAHKFPSNPYTAMYTPRKSAQTNQQSGATNLGKRGAEAND